MDGDVLLERADTLPRDPGVYQFLDDDDRVLYVGKAVELRNRVRSYADPRSERIRRMVAEATDLDVAITDTESQALLLEANLIKRHRPRYNVRLKDDKSYPLVELTDHAFPRIRITRDPDSGSTVFGPYTDKGLLDTIVKALRDVYGVRGCSDHKYANRSRPCLDYDIGICTAPCTDEIGQAEYLANVAAVESFFAGDAAVLADPIEREMEVAASACRFERAANLRDVLDAVERFHDPERRGTSHRDDYRGRMDVLGLSLAGPDPVVALLRAEDGQLVDRERHHLVAPDDTENAGTVLGAFIPQYYAERELPDAVLCPEQPVGEGLASWLASAGVDLRVPAAGREATLVDLAVKNATRYRQQPDAADQLAAALDLDRADRIEGFDVSHAHGRATVGSNVVFVDGSADKSGYRRKKLPDSNDDYESMHTLLEWRARRARAGRDERPDPDLLVIDGGEGQLQAAMSALEAVGWKVAVVALAKERERVITPETTFDWADDAPELHLLQRVRDEAHRFAVQYHELLRDDVSTPLDDLTGIGPARRRRLLRRFGSVAGIKNASDEELQQVEGIGEATATVIREQLGS